MEAENPLFVSGWAAREFSQTELGKATFRSGLSSSKLAQEERG